MLFGLKEVLNQYTSIWMGFAKCSIELRKSAKLNFYWNLNIKFYWISWNNFFFFWRTELSSRCSHSHIKRFVIIIVLVNMFASFRAFSVGKIQKQNWMKIIKKRILIQRTTNNPFEPYSHSHMIWVISKKKLLIMCPVVNWFEYKMKLNSGSEIDFELIIITAHSNVNIEQINNK